MLNKLGLGDQLSRFSQWWLLMLAALIQGCATMSEPECRNADWRTVGYEDGAMGASAFHIGKYREACAKYGVSPDLSGYREGREQGLRQYCRPHNGFRLGERGGNYAGICPPETEPEFVAAYEDGRRVYAILASIRHTQNRLRSKKHQLTTLKAARQSRQAELVSEGLSAPERAELLVQVLELTRDQGAVENEISELKAELARKHETLAHTRATNTYH